MSTRLELLLLFGSLLILLILTFIFILTIYISPSWSTRWIVKYSPNMGIALRSAIKSKLRMDEDWRQIKKLIEERVLEKKTDNYTVDLLAKKLFSDDVDERRLSLDLLVETGNFRGFDAILLRGKELDDFAGYCILKICWEDEYLKNLSKEKEEDLAAILEAAANGPNPDRRRHALQGMESWNPVHIRALESKNYRR